jgi:hypothetical protein
MKPSLTFLSLLIPCAFGGEPNPPRHLRDAVELVENLDLRNTSYEHGDGRIHWTGTRAAHTDCSGFLNGLLQHSYGYDREAFRRWFDSGRPTAARYHDAITEQRGFTAIKRLTDVRPGDILAVKYLKRRDNTGHVMLVVEPPQPMRARKPLVDGTQQWQVVVIDSSRSGHGPGDTRARKGQDGSNQGLGRGVLRIYADRQGRVAGFSWSTRGVSEFKSPDLEHLVIGRLQPNFKP